MLIGTIYSGINNIYQVKMEHNEMLQCRIKGKILNEEDVFYNPLAPGDQVEILPTDSGYGLITARIDRRNRFARWNKKRENWQIVAANIDLVLVVVSVGSPPFRPRFVDRALINSMQGDVPAAVLINKIDLGPEPWVTERMDAWVELGYPVYQCSAENGIGIDALQHQLKGKTTALFGQSGVGKSSLINVLAPGIDMATGTISSKHDRGRHVTNFGRLVDTSWGGRLVDTPGVREILVRGIDADELPQWFPEFVNLSEKCNFQPCSHRHEPGCAVVQELESGNIFPDRYENYLRIRLELENLRR